MLTNYGRKCLIKIILIFILIGVCSIFIYHLFYVPIEPDFVLVDKGGYAKPAYALDLHNMSSGLYQVICTEGSGYLIVNDEIYYFHKETSQNQNNFSQIINIPINTIISIERNNTNTWFSLKFYYIKDNNYES